MSKYKSDVLTSRNEEKTKLILSSFPEVSSFTGLEELNTSNIFIVGNLYYILEAEEKLEIIQELLTISNFLETTFISIESIVIIGSLQDEAIDMVRSSGWQNISLDKLLIEREVKLDPQVEVIKRLEQGNLLGEDVVNVTVKNRHHMFLKRIRNFLAKSKRYNKRKKRLNSSEHLIDILPSVEDIITKLEDVESFEVCKQCTQFLRVTSNDKYKSHYALTEKLLEEIRVSDILFLPKEEWALSFKDSSRFFCLDFDTIALSEIKVLINLNKNLNLFKPVIIFDSASGIDMDTFLFTTATLTSTLRWDRVFTLNTLNLIQEDYIVEEGSTVVSNL